MLIAAVLLVYGAIDELDCSNGGRTANGYSSGSQVWTGPGDGLRLGAYNAGVNTILRMIVAVVCLWVGLEPIIRASPAPAPPASPVPPAVVAATATAPAGTATELPASMPARRMRIAPRVPGHATWLPANPRVAIVSLKGMMDSSRADLLKLRIDKAVADKVDLIVLELDTPGGAADQTLKLTNLIRKLQVPTLAWVHDQAYSAGTYLAAACEGIVMSPSSAMGDCAPVVPGQNMPQDQRQKALAALMEDFRESARLAGYDFSIFHAMVVTGVELYLIEHPTTGQRRVVNQVDYHLMVLGQDLPPVAASANVPVPPARLVATDADVGQWRLVTQPRFMPGPLVQPIHDGQTLLTLSQNRAQEFGLVLALVADDAQLGQFLNAASVQRYDQTWSQGAAYWLTQPWMRAILLVIVLICGYLELQAPGMSVPGIIAVLALVLLLFTPFLMGLSAFWHLLLFFVGLVMLLLEIFVTPGFGVLGVAGLICMFVGLVLGGVPSSSSGLPASGSGEQLQWSVLWMFAGLLTAAVGGAVITSYFGKIPGLNRLILKDPDSTPIQAWSSPDADPHHPAQTDRLSGDNALGQGLVAIGDQGITASELRPSGQARIHGQLIDVISQGQWLGSGQAVQVVEVRGNVIVVAPTRLS